MEQARKNQGMKGQQRTEQNRWQMEEMNRKKMADQQAQMEQMKKNQDELMKKRQQKKLEDTAVLTVRRMIHKFRNATLETFDAIKQELDETLAKELEACGAQKEQVTKECENVVIQTKQRLEQEEEARKKAEEQKAADLIKNKEQLAKATELLAQLEKDVEKAEESGKGVGEELEPFKEDNDMRVEDIEACAKAVETAAADATQQSQLCQDFILKEGPQIREVKQIEGEPPITCLKDLGNLANRLAEVKKTLQNSMALCKREKEKRIKIVSAKEKYGTFVKSFNKYGKDGKLSRKEVAAFAKGEFKFTVPAGMLDTICNALITEGSKGVEKENFHRLQAMVGVAREAAIDDKRRAAREAREKEVARSKEKLADDVKEATELVTAASEAISKAETGSAELKPAQVKDMKSQELLDSLEKVDKMVADAKDSVKKATEAIQGLSEHTEAELKSLLLAESRKLEISMKSFDAKITAVSATSTKLQAEATKKQAQETEKLRVHCMDVMYHHQSEKQLSNEELFEALNLKKDGKMKESELVKFFKTCVKKAPKEGEEPVAITEEDSSRLFAYFDDEEEGFITKDKFLSIVRRFMKVVKASVITDAQSIKSKLLRRLEEGEVIEVLAAPILDAESQVTRMRVKSMVDDTQGWVTAVGNAGKVFFEEGGNEYKVVKETILTGSFVIGAASSQKDRKLKVGEIVEVREFAKKEEASGLMRMKVRCKASGKVGWATSEGNTGIKFLEIL
jgi:hypothetical protein